MLEGLSPLHLILIFGIVLLVVGPRRLPELGSALGKTLREFRDATSGLTESTTQPATSQPAATPAPVQPVAPQPMPSVATPASAPTAAAPFAAAETAAPSPADRT